MNEKQYRQTLENNRRTETVTKLSPELPACRADPETWPEHTCSVCGQTRKFALLPAGSVCYDCGDAAEHTARLRAKRRAESGIHARHAKFQAWADLQGPPPYLAFVRSVRQFAESRGSLLALIGTRGTGKTQIGCVAVATKIDAGGYAKIVTTIELMIDLKRRYGDPESGGDTQWFRDWTAPHLLVVDEIGELVSGEHSRSMLTALLDRRYADQRPTILIGNVPEREFASVVGSSVADRCNEGGGIIVCDSWASFRK